ncbi:MAG TPA: heme exporter protein CcmB [Steroidobacteraceae bacterium]|jgi:heme exporter protein B|nr:heme exporter protein CcmB [Steroidobacteraceae bacterium]
MSAVSAARLIIGRELRLSFRRPDQLLQPLVFFLIVTTLFPLGLNLRLSLLKDMAPGVLWTAALLSSLLSLDSLFKSDADDGTLDQLALSGQSLTVIVIAKTVAHWLVSGAALVLASPLVAIALGIPSSAFGTMLMSLVLGTLTLSWLGSIGAALTVGLKRGNVLLSLIVLPLAMPLLIFGAGATDRAISGTSPAGALYFLGSLCVFTCTLAPFAAAAALRITLE